MRAAIFLSVVACGRLEFEPLAGSVAVTFGDNDDDAFRGVARDVTLREETPAENRGGCAIVDVDEDVSSSNRSVISFDVAALPASATIVSAELELTVSTMMDAQMGSGQLLIRPVAEAWSEGGGCPGASGANWLERMPGIAWTPTASSPPTTVDVLVATVDAPLALDQQFTIALDVATIAAWRDDPATNFGLALLASTADSAILVSSEGDVGKRPRLRVVYMP